MITRRVAVWMTRFDCAADCGRSLDRGQLVIVEERPDFFVPANRYQVWHYACHPTVVNRRFREILQRARAS